MMLFKPKTYNEIIESFIYYKNNDALVLRTLCLNNFSKFIKVLEFKSKKYPFDFDISWAISELKINGFLGPITDYSHTNDLLLLMSNFLDNLYIEFVDDQLIGLKSYYLKWNDF